MLDDESSRRVPGVDVRARAQVLGLVLLALLDVVLVYLAVDHVRGAAGQAAEAAPSSSRPTETVSNSGEPTSTTTVEGDAAGLAGLLAVSPDGTVLRATRGACGEGSGASVEVSGDGGATFTDVTPEQTLSLVLRVQALSFTSFQVVGADAECSLATFATSNGGRSWSRTPGTAGTWHLLGGDGALIHAPQGDVEVGCTPSAVSSISELVARVLCRDGRLLGTADAGRTWSPLGRVSGAVDITFTSPEDGLALGADDECEARVLATRDGGDEWSVGECLGTGSPEAIAASGRYALAQVAGSVFRLTVRVAGGASS